MRGYRNKKQGIVITAKSEGKLCDFVSRMFAPHLGVPEDPVTGSAHCVLAPYWSQRLGKSVLQAYQASRRGGSLEVENKASRVLLRGHAVTAMRSELFI
jgi:predicted PhzF superfamily epimerase YddE/YHI9